ncbi:uncharacterized protein LOC132552974 [Ylistrum balloti]|uniref:uncharacterized protein LOC132552974 n=1 Tax=Ylistrum balloti TaxID=509963 RepID=UPI0029058739|nr:uncharacterized protein LOC132552974 [Ylistrum balloti]
MSDLSCPITGILLLAGVGVLLLVILLPMSFSGIEYYEYGFKRQKSTGTVTLDEVYSSGKHLLGPDYEFKIFQADAHFVTLNQVRAFTSDGLEVRLTVNFQYYLRKDDLPELHRAYDIYYKDVMRSSAIDALKGAVPVFTTREMFSERKVVEEAMYKAVRERLGGICCQKNCNLWKYACPASCKSREICMEADHGLFANVKYFQMGQVYIPHDVKERLLRSLTLKEDAEKEKLLQDAQVERKITASKVQTRRNEAAEVRQEAEATSAMIQLTSRANYTAVVESSRSRGLTGLYSRLGITDQRIKNSFDYLRTLRGLDNVFLSVDFDQNIVGNFGKM